MTITCKICSISFQSLIIDPPIAFDQITKKMLEHCKRKHPKEVMEFAQTLTKVQMALAQTMSLANFALIPEDEKWVMGLVEKGMDIVMAGIGYTRDGLEDAKCLTCNGTGEEFSGVCHCGEEMDKHTAWEHTPKEMTRRCEICNGTGIAPVARNPQDTPRPSPS